MSTLPNEEIEGRLNAQREALAFVIAHLATIREHDRDGARGLLEALQAHSLFQDHQEDPGAVPSGPAFAIEAAAKHEFRRILADAEAQLDGFLAEDRPPAGS